MQDSHDTGTEDSMNKLTITLQAAALGISEAAIEHAQTHPEAFRGSNGAVLLNAVRTLRALAGEFEDKPVQAGSYGEPDEVIARLDSDQDVILELEHMMLDDGEPGPGTPPQ